MRYALIALFVFLAACEPEPMAADVLEWDADEASRMTGLTPEQEDCYDECMDWLVEYYNDPTGTASTEDIAQTEANLDFANFIGPAWPTDNQTMYLYVCGWIQDNWDDCSDDGSVINE